MKNAVVILTSVHRACDARIFHRQARTLAESGYTVMIAGDHRRAETIDGISIIPVPRPRNRFSRMLVSPIRLGLIALRSRFRICHLHDPELLPVGVVLALFGRTVIYDVHEDYPQQLLSKHYLCPLARRVMSRLIAAVERAAGSILHATISATKEIASRFPPDKVCIVRNYPRLPASTSATTPPAGSSRGPFRLVHIAGTLTHVRGITSLVSAMGLLDDTFELVLAGSWEPPTYLRELRRLPGFARVRHIGQVAHPCVWPLYRSCHVGVICSLPLPRHLTALPVKLFEFMAAGLPVVVSDFPLLRSIVESNRCGLCVNPTDPRAIANAIRLLARNPELARTMGENGIAAVQKRYNWSTEAATLLELYSRLSLPRGCPATQQPILSVAP
ncbi:MAG: glycosyltransferase family 4 protein [candidate division WOR-3 bacterium]